MFKVAQMVILLYIFSIHSSRFYHTATNETFNTHSSIGDLKTHTCWYERALWPDVVVKLFATSLDLALPFRGKQRLSTTRPSLTGTRTTTVQKNHISGFIFTSSCGSLGFCIVRLKLFEKKTIKCFSEELNKYLANFCDYVVVVRKL